jgi:DNA-binding NarL/FixJ family response regulator
MKTTEISDSARSFLQTAIEGAITRGTYDVAVAAGGPSAATAQRAHLTRRQLEVLALLCEGLTNKDISRKLAIGNATVKIHVSSILRALNVTSRLQAAIAARRMGLVAEKPRAVAAAARDGRQPMVLRVTWDGESARIIGIAEELAA